MCTHEVPAAQVSKVEYHYQPAKFDATTEKQESYKHWDLPSRPARPPAPMRAILPFTGACSRLHLHISENHAPLTWI